MKKVDNYNFIVIGAGIVFWTSMALLFLIKSQKYIGSPLGLELLQKFMKCGNDVHIFGIIRDPRDIIMSQYELWHEHVPYATPEFRENGFREKMWIDYYMQFESL